MSSRVQAFIDENSGLGFISILSNFSRQTAEMFGGRVEARMATLFLASHRCLISHTEARKNADWSYLLLVTELLLQLLVEEINPEEVRKIRDELTSTLLSLDDLGSNDDGISPLPEYLARLWWAHGHFQEYLAHFQSSESYFKQCEKALAQVECGRIELPHCRYFKHWNTYSRSRRNSLIDKNAVMKKQEEERFYASYPRAVHLFNEGKYEEVIKGLKNLLLFLKDTVWGSSSYLTQ